MRLTVLAVLTGAWQFPLSSAQQLPALRHELQNRDITFNTTAYDLLTECTRTCQERILQDQSCSPNDKCYCSPKYNGHLLDDLTDCVQASCPRLEDLLQWQHFRAKTCSITPRRQTKVQDSVSYTLFGIATIFVAARFLSRSRYLRGPGFWWDDWTILIIWGLTIELAICLVYQQQNNAGADSFAVSVSDVRGTLRWVYISLPFYFTGTYGTKLAMCLLYLRMWEADLSWRHLIRWKSKPAFCRVCWITAGLCIQGIIGFGLGGLLTSWPNNYYKGDSPEVRVWKWGIQIPAAIFSAAAVNIFMDFVVLLLPVWRLSTLRNISFTRKMAISTVFLLGFVVTICSIVRVTYMVPLIDSANATWDFGHFGFWSEIEVHGSMITCNMPQVLGLVMRWRKRNFPWQQRSQQPRSGAAVDSKAPEMSNATSTTTGTSASEAVVAHAEQWENISPEEHERRRDAWYGIGPKS